ncbi:MAG: arylesterase [Verrucomicrobiota bacterium]|nr:arylesterase [Verrucomicrobiota bacterium]
MGKLTFRVIGIALALAIFVRAETTTKTVVFLGDSLGAGYGVKPNESFPALIGEKIKAAKLPYEVENAGLSGDTTAGGLRRIDWLLQRQIDVLVIELGGNDGLRGLPVAALKSNIQSIIDKVRAKNPEVKIVIAGMRIPPNIGTDYARDFAAAFPELAQKNNATLIPFLLEGVGGMREFNQADSIHPTAEGHRAIAETVWKILEPLLR